MLSAVRLGTRAATIAAVGALLGCSVVDRYSGRAIVYNLEAERAQEQALLLNVVRAYQGRPMQFTTVSTITGTASATGTAAYTVPTVPVQPVIASTGVAFPPLIPNGVFGGSLSGGPTFTVPVLDTQEFYRGILTAIPGQIWDLYIQANYPRDLLFNLFVEKVVMQRSDCPSNSHIVTCEFVFSNSVTKDIEINLFQALADYLLALGLTTESSKDAPSVPFVNPASINVRFVGNPPADNSNKAEVLGAPGGSDSDSLTVSTSYDLCFEPLFPNDAKLVDSKSRCGETPKNPEDKKPAGKQPASNQPDKKIKKSGSATVAIKASNDFTDRLKQIADTVDDGHYHYLSNSLEAFRNRPVNITVYMRHTEGMIYYLGELVRRQYSDDNPRKIWTKLDAPYTRHDTTKACDEGRGGCAYIFRLHQGAAPEAGDVVSVLYDGQWYSLPRRSQSDLSALTFDILKQQIALNSSAKSLPQSSVITTVGQ